MLNTFFQNVYILYTINKIIHIVLFFSLTNENFILDIFQEI